LGNFIEKRRNTLPKKCSIGRWGRAGGKSNEEPKTPKGKGRGEENEK